MKSIQNVFLFKQKLRNLKKSLLVPKPLFLKLESTDPKRSMRAERVCDSNS